jgi:hypothetical protein
MWKEYNLSIRVFKWEKHSFMLNRPIMVNGRETCISWMNTIFVRTWSVLHNTLCWEWRRHLKGIPHICQSFQEGQIFTLAKIGLYWCIEETLVSARRMQCKFEATVSYTLFPLENWVRMWNEYSLSVSVFKWENVGNQKPQSDKGTLP